MASYFKCFLRLILNMLKDPKIPSLISLPMNFCSVTMASRRSKDKHLAETSKKIVKKEPASPIEIANCFTMLGTIPRPNYSTILASSYDPYVITPINQPIRTTFPRNSNNPQYIKKKNISKICFVLNSIESQLLILSNLLKAISFQDFTGFLSIEKRIYSIILIFCVMKDLLLSTPYLTKLIPPKLFTTLFTWLILFLKNIYMYVCIYICMYVSIYIYVYILLHVYILLYVSMYIYITICVYLYTLLYVYIDVHYCMYISTYMYMYITICIYITAYIYINVSIYVCIYVYICVCIYIYIYIYVCMYVCMYTK